ncbi:MAG: hypothetical protein ACKOJF_31815, partial [Planctomycetaceae bacterium]
MKRQQPSVAGTGRNPLQPATRGVNRALQSLCDHSIGSHLDDEHQDGCTPSAGRAGPGTRHAPCCRALVLVGLVAG